MRRVLTLLLLSACSAVAQTYETTVSPLPGENLASSCDYEMTLVSGVHPVRAVWVLYDRGLDIMKFYSDSDVLTFARRHDMAMLMAHHCASKNAPGGPKEMDMNPSHGLGRALFTALGQLAKQSNHPELAEAKLVLLGFSGTGALFAHFVGYAPERVVASIPTDPGHFDPVGIDNVVLPPEGLLVPELIMAGGADKVCGTKKPYDYFRYYRDQGAPWAFLVQNKTPHCCIINTKVLLLLWLEKIIELRNPSPTRPLRRIETNTGWLGFIRTCPSTVRDTWEIPTWDVCDARIVPVGHADPADQVPAGWFPSRRVAMAWLAFIKQPAHPVTSMP